MEVFGAVVICIFASLFAIIMLGILIVAGIYTVSYIISDFQARKCRWRIESRNRQLYRYIRNLDKYRPDSCEPETEERDSDCDDSDSDTPQDDEEVGIDQESVDFDDVISEILKG